MSVLYLIRHGQASAGSGDYDRLSSLGEDQSRALGELWAGRGLTFDRVFVGPLRRQRQTCEAVTEVYRQPGPGGYAETTTLQHGEEVEILALPAAGEFSIEEILGP